MQGRRQKNFHGGNGKKDRKIAKTTENSTIKPLSGGGQWPPLPSAADAHGE